MHSDTSSPWEYNEMEKWSQLSAIPSQNKQKHENSGLNLVSKVAVSYAVIMVMSTILKENASGLFVRKDLSEA